MRVLLFIAVLSLFVGCAAFEKMVDKVERAADKATTPDPLTGQTPLEKVAEGWGATDAGGLGAVGLLALQNLWLLKRRRDKAKLLKSFAAGKSNTLSDIFPVVGDTT